MPSSGGFQFMLGAIYSSVNDDRRIEILTGGTCKARDFHACHGLLLPCVAAGFARPGEKKVAV